MMHDEKLTASHTDDASAAPAEGIAPPEGQGEGPEEREEREEREQRPRFTVNDRRFWHLDEEELAQEGDHPKQPSYVEQLQQQVEEKDRQLREYIAAYKKEVVEGLEKTKERLERDAAARMEQLRGQLATPMMDVLDVLERSVAAAESAQETSALLTGVKLVVQLMVQKLGEMGLRRLETVGQPFDPSQHEAVAVASVSDPSQHNIVLVELRPGFALGERVVRPASVQVGKLAQA